MSFYDDLRAGVGPGSEVEQTFGLPAILTRITPGTRNPDTGKVSGKTTATIPVNVAKRPAKVESKDGGKSVSVAFDMWIKPIIGDIITFAGETFKVVSIEADDSDGIGISWVAFVESGA